MEHFEKLLSEEHEQLIFCSNKESGLKAIIAVHNTSLGPALGGTRMLNYSSTAEAVEDALRLAKGMTYKAAIAGLNFGGGSSIIIGDANKDKSELLFRTFGKYIEGLAGRFITAEDVGTTVRDMEYVRMETKYVTGVSKSIGGSGDPAPVTAYGVYIGMKACAKEKWGNDSLRGRKIAVQGAGHVSKFLVEYLYNEGAELFVSDIQEAKARKILEFVKAEIVPPDDIYDLDVEIFSPNALGAILNDDAINRLKAEIVAGAANNQLANEEKHGKMLMDKGILYAPDYVINSGGLINVANELEGYRQDRAMKHAESIFEIVAKVIKLSQEAEIPTNIASQKLAESRLEKIGRISNIYSGKSEFAGRLGELAKK